MIKSSKFFYFGNRAQRLFLIVLLFVCFFLFAPQNAMTDSKDSLKNSLVFPTQNNLF